MRSCSRPARGIERIANCDVQVLVRMILARLPIDHDLAARRGQVNAHVINRALPMAASSMILHALTRSENCAEAPPLSAGSGPRRMAMTPCHGTRSGRLRSYASPDLSFRQHSDVVPGCFDLDQSEVRHSRRRRDVKIMGLVPAQLQVGHSCVRRLQEGPQGQDRGRFQARAMPTNVGHHC